MILCFTASEEPHGLGLKNVPSAAKPTGDERVVELIWVRRTRDDVGPGFW